VASPTLLTSAPDATSVCADRVTDDPEPVGEPAEVSADSARSEPDVDAPPADEPASTADFLADDDSDSDTPSEDSPCEFLEPPTDESALTPAFLADDDGESDSELEDLSGELPRCEPPGDELPADEPPADVSAAPLFGVDAPVAPLPGAEPGDDSDDDSDELDPRESVPDSSAHATPGVVATAVPTPNATANAPTRPTYLAYPIGVCPPIRAEPCRSQQMINTVLRMAQRAIGD
jgi:hypothetical protein